MMFAIVIGTLASFWAFLYLLYETGAFAVHGYIVGIGEEVFGRRLERWINNPTGPNWDGTQSMGIGAAMTWVLYFLRHKFMWWPFHPIGYVMTAATWGRSRGFLVLCLYRLDDKGSSSSQSSVYGRINEQSRFS